MPPPRRPIVFPFNMKDCERSVCDGCPGHFEDPEGCNTCEAFQKYQIDIVKLHEAVIAAEHEPTPEEKERIDGDELCFDCEFGSSVCTFWGNLYEPPEYEPWCEACQALVEECACDGRYFKPRTP